MPTTDLELVPSCWEVENSEHTENWGYIYKYFDDDKNKMMYEANAKDAYDSVEFDSLDAAKLYFINIMVEVGKAWKHGTRS